MAACMATAKKGPYGGRPAYDDVIQGESGLAGTFAARDGAPVLAPTVIADKTAGLLASSGLIAGLFQRLRTGKGVYVETAMFEALVGYTLLEHHYGAMFVPPEGAPGYVRALSPERKPYTTPTATSACWPIRTSSGAVSGTWRKSPNSRRSALFLNGRACAAY